MTPDRLASAGARPPVAFPAIAIGACAGYYLASVVGLELRLPPATPSVLWPPNAVLTSVLLLSPRRQWPALLLAVLPVHLLIQLQTEFPLPLILALFVTNCLEALIAAGGMSRLSDAPTRFDTLSRLAAFFLAAVAAAPLLSSFADAAAVTWFRGESYWTVWKARSLSNVLAELTVVPAVVGGVCALQQWFRGVRPPRAIEAAILGAALLGIGLLDSGSALWRISAIGAVSSQTPLAVQLPFLIWAAMRFGPTGTGLTLMTTSVLSAWAVIHGVGPFAFIAPGTTVTAVTISLIVVATTLLSLATLLEERRQAQHALRTRLRFEELLSRLSAALVRLPANEMTSALDAWLWRIAGVLGVDSVTVFTATGPDALHMIYSWTAGAAAEVNRAIPTDQERRARRCLATREPVVVLDRHDDEAPGVAPTASAPGLGFRAGGAIPLIGEGDLIGALAFASNGEPRWSADLVANAELVGEVLASVLRRQRSEDALRQSEIMKSAILQSLASGVAVIDRDGALLQVNDRWAELTKESEWLNAPIGSNVVTRCWAAFERGDAVAGDVIAGLTAVLERARSRFIVEHRIEVGGAPAWLSLTAVPLNRPEGGAVLTRADVTELRRAEMNAQRSRDELAHVSRVSTIGELTASLAHELNQPLAAIMTNAQAGRRILDSARPDFGEVRAILRDIVADDRRASDVIGRLRVLLRKGEPDMTRVDITATIRSVVDLFTSEAVIRNVMISLGFADDPAYVRGDRVQLQQVILNLVHNGMEAMSAPQHDGARRIVIGCRRESDRHVTIDVHDTGPGLHPGTEEAIFEPFFTTKSSGMGMGLSIVRSIVEAHHGTVHASNDPAGGARFQVVLPADRDLPA